MAYTTSMGAIGAGIYFYIRNVQELPPAEYPKEFKSLIYPNNTFGLYKYNLARKLDMSEITKTVFTQRLYDLEYFVSQTSFDPNFEFKVGSKIGNMVLEDLPGPNVAIFRYLFPGFNFRFYLETKDQHLHFGFVDYTGSLFEELGSRIYVPCLLRGAADLLNKSV